MELQGNDYEVSHEYKPQVPEMVITMIRSSNEQISSQTRYLVTPDGVVDSLRFPQDQHIFIGRQQVNEEGIRPNDIILPANDRAISRSHCRIDCRFGFPVRRITDEWIAFLMIEHPRLGQNSPGYYLPKPVIAHILSFIKEPRAFYVTDLGSVCGTYIKVSNSDPIELQEGQVYLVGNDINIEVESVITWEAPMLTQSSEDSQNVTMQSVSEMPSIKITISKVPVDTEETMANATTYSYMSDQGGKVITLGRSQTCDVQIVDSTISRTQCRIVYNGSKWLMYDGIDAKASVNGTWLSVCRKHREPREHSAPFPIKNGSQIKISDTILQVNYGF